MLVHQRVSMKNGGFMGLIQEKYRKMDVNVCRNGSCPWIMVIWWQWSWDIMGYHGIINVYLPVHEHSYGSHAPFSWMKKLSNNCEFHSYVSLSEGFLMGFIRGSWEDERWCAWSITKILPLKLAEFFRIFLVILDKLSRFLEDHPTDSDKDH